MTLDRLLFDTYWALDHFSFLSRNRQMFSRQRRELHQKCLRKRDNAENICMPVEERREPFLTRTALQGLPSDRPVVFRGLGRGTRASRNWSLDFFVARHGNLRQPFFRSELDGIRMDILSLHEGLPDVLSANPRRILFGGPFDMLNVDPSLRQDMELDRLTDSSFFTGKFTKLFKLFFAGQGQWATLHSEFGDTLNFVYKGQKRWTLFHPEDSRFLLPEAARNIFLRSRVYSNASILRDGRFGLRYWDVNLEEGDAIFCPNYFWHFVETGAASISAEYKWGSVRMLMQHPFLSMLLLTATNPSMISQFRRIANPSIMPSPDIFS